jgi:hypothetical protein
MPSRGCFTDGTTSTLAWFKGSYSSHEGGVCLDVSIAQEAVHVRDSKDLARRPFRAGGNGWADFVAYVASN